MAYISRAELNKLFDNSEAKKIKLNAIRMQTNKIHHQPIQIEHGYNLRKRKDIQYPTNESPMTKRILESLTPTSSYYMKKTLREDDIQHDIEIGKNEEDDPLFEYYENTEIGVFLEYWLCYNIRCPVCGGELGKFTSPNQAVIDLKCMNSSHDVKYFQVKSTESGKTYIGKKYFNLDKSNQNNSYIRVGSTKYGYAAHIIKPSDIDKGTLIGYICIEYSLGHDRHIKINKDKSFFVIPNVSSKIDEHYYDYINLMPPIVKFNLKNNIIKTFRDENITTLNVNLDTSYAYA